MYIEQVMIFALGFLSAGLLTLLFLPAFWRRAMTLSKRRLEMQMPLSMAEIVAERDQLRAEFAAEQRRLEQRLEAGARDRAQDMVELGERLAKISHLDQDLAKLRMDSYEVARDLKSATRALAEAEAELSTKTKQLYDIEGLLERRNSAYGVLLDEFDSLTIRSNEQRTLLAALETRLSAQEAEIENLVRNLEKAQLELSEAHEDGDLARLERDQFRSDAHSVQLRRETLQREFESQAARLEDVQNQLRSLHREKDRQSTELAEKARQLDDARGRIDQLNAQIVAHARIMREHDDKAASEAERTRADAAALEGALEMQRRENQTLRREIAELKETLKRTQPPVPMSGASSANGLAPASEDELATLRKAISDVAEKIARASGENTDKGRPVPASPDQPRERSAPAAPHRSKSRRERETAGGTN